MAEKRLAIRVNVNMLILRINVLMQTRTIVNICILEGKRYFIAFWPEQVGVSDSNPVVLKAQVASLHFVAIDFDVPYLLPVEIDEEVLIFEIFAQLEGGAEFTTVERF